MREIRTSGSMSGDGKRGRYFVAIAPALDSTLGALGVRMTDGEFRMISERSKMTASKIVFQQPIRRDFGLARDGFKVRQGHDFLRRVFLFKSRGELYQGACCEENTKGFRVSIDPRKYYASQTRHAKREGGC